MRLHILSDLHLEIGAFEPPKVDADVVVLAGDIHVGLEGVKWAQIQWPETPVIYVAGNHEYYHHEVPKLTDKLRQLCAGTNIHFLENADVMIGGIVFLGCTLWTDFQLAGDAPRARALADRGMADYFEINVTGQNRCLHPDDTERLHFESRRWLEQQLAKVSSTRTVIVTHHAPSPRSIPPWHDGSGLNPAFVSNLDTFIEASSVPLWIHGHTHHGVDYRIGNTRVLANQRGYTVGPVKNFVPDLVIDI